VRSAVGVFVKQDHERPNSCGILVAEADSVHTSRHGRFLIAHPIIQSCQSRSSWGGSSSNNSSAHRVLSVRHDMPLPRHESLRREDRPYVFLHCCRIHNHLTRMLRAQE
jgi:hypothetical protein